ncbi:MAG: hypothetical protein K6T87_16035 [Roseiflexus sp.]|uniref:hypothetical protein n=1 Tax=Roseiflexus sp. TaxID=2562120 RepID=UPI0025DD572D|nr:hypothetical protein [Roseiflexus sp.]MCL6542066.1 hypothetical protein [Roseiflexus sp.]
MAVLSSKEFIFQKVSVNGFDFSPEVEEVITPEMEDPYWEITYLDSSGRVETVIFATGNVLIEARPKELRIVKGGKNEEAIPRRIKKEKGDYDEAR